MDLHELKELNITKGQAKTYEALLELGSGGIQAIQEKTGHERRAIYDILNKLIEKGLVTFTIEKGIKTYQLTHPRNLKEQIQKKQESLSELFNKLPLITEKFTAKKQKVHAEIYRGNKALQALINEMLEHKESFWIGGNSGVEQIGLEINLFFKRWDKRRVKQKATMYDLVDHGTYLEDYLPKDLKKHKRNYYKYCQLPKNLKSPMVIIIFGNKVCQILWSKQPFAFVLESKEIKDSFMKYFHYFWKEPRP
jgi:HTH-type transcriptional regulator, sugar sensing transcriptional regulator